MLFLEKKLIYPIAAVVSIAIGGVVYVAFLVILKCLGASELELLDNNSKLKKLIDFCGIFACKSHCNAVK